MIAYIQVCVNEPTEHLPLQFSALKLTGSLYALKDGADRFHAKIWPKYSDSIYGLFLRLIISVGGIRFLGLP
jgi:hypothetical protein